MYTTPHHYVYCPSPFCILSPTILYSAPLHYAHCLSPLCILSLTLRYTVLHHYVHGVVLRPLPCLSRVRATFSSLRLSVTSAKTPSAPLTLLTLQTLLLILPFLFLVYSLRTSVALSQQHPTISRSNRFVCQLTEATSLVALSFYTRVCVSLAYQSILFYIYIFLSQLSSILILYSVLGTRSFHL